MGDMLPKLATLFGITQNFTIVELSKEHTMKLLTLIETTDVGKVLLQLCVMLRGDEWKTGFLLTTRKETGEFMVIYYVDSVNRLYPHLDALKATEKFLAANGMKMEVDTIENASRTELVKW
jgi:hypothetical protein